jgi:hypothetical protein
MRVGEGTHLTYCTNIHAGESWAEVRASLERFVPAVKAKISPEAPFGLGLRLSNQAALELDQPDRLESFLAFLEREQLYVFTLNGFPYGAFHRTRVKEDVYLPDWRHDERVRYSDRLADLLARLLPRGLDGTVSTVPGAFRPAMREDERDGIAANLVRHAATLVGLLRDTGRSVALALEPEPGCLLETTAEAVALFDQHLFSDVAAARLGELTGLGRAESHDALRRHLGLCLDACHAAVEYEDPGELLAIARSRGVAVRKVQLGTGLRLEHAGPAGLAALRPFADDVYLHQVVVRTADGDRRFNDLGEALAAAASPTTASDAEWRIHFHVPVFREELGPFRNTQGFLRELLALHARDPVSSHLEVETYTWEVLPAAFRSPNVVDDIVRELEWVRARLEPAAPGPPDAAGPR